MTFISDQYANLDTRTIEGHDIGVYYNVDTALGHFAFKYNGSFYDEYEQEGTGGPTAAILAAKAANPAIVYPVAGIGDLLGINGNQESRQAASLSWYNGDFGASVSANRVGDFVQILANGDAFEIPSMTTYNFKFDYSMNIGETDTRIRLGVNNFSDERAPIADRFFGYFADAHRDYGRTYYLDIRLGF